MILVKASIIFNNGDVDERILCKVNYDKQIIEIYNESSDKIGLIPLNSIMKLQFNGYFDTEKGEIESLVDEGW